MNQDILTLRKGSSLLHQVLLTGEILRHGEVWKTLPREVLRKDEGVVAVVFEVTPWASFVFPHWSRVFWKLVKPEGLIQTLIPFAAVLLYGQFQNWTGIGILAVFPLFGVLFFQLAARFFNDVEDYLRLVDLPGSPSSLILGNDVLQKGWMSAKQLRWLGNLSLIMGILFGLPPLVQSPKILFGVGLAAVLGVLTHSKRPFGMKYRASGDLSVFFLLGPFLTFGFSEAIFHQTDGQILFIGVLFGILSWGISLTKQLQVLGTESIRIERSSNLASVMGFKRTRHFLFFLYGISWILYSWMIFNQGLGLVVSGVASGTVFFLICRWLQNLYQVSGPISPRLSALRSESLRLYLSLGVLFSAGLVLAKVL